MSLKCQKCGAALPENAQFCPECGTAVRKKKTKKTKAPAKPAPANNSVNILYLVALGALIVAGIYGYRFFTPTVAPNPNSASRQAEEQRSQQPPSMDQNTLNQLRSQLEANPQGVTENVNLGNFLFDNQRFEDALEYYHKALEKEPDNVAVIVDAGVCYFNMRDFEQARDYFQRALNINPKHPNALYNLGVVSAQLGDMETTLEKWNKLIEVAPESDLAQTAKRMMDQVKRSMSQN